MKRRRIRQGLAALGLVAAAFAASFAVPPFTVHEFDAVRASWRASDAWLLDRSGEPLSRIRIDHQRRRGEWVPAGDVSPALIAMVLASEDKRFREHGGVDWLAMPGAIRQTLAGERRGGSTLTMQLASYLDPELETSGRRNVLDKWRQMRQALAIERHWSKDQILEAWLNLTPFRGEVEGVDAAARSLYGKRAQGLDRVESALLAALVRAPNAGASRVAKRACGLLAAGGLPPATSRLSPPSGASESAFSHDAGRDCLIAEGLAAGGLRAGRLERDLDGVAPHLARRLLETAGVSVTSTLDARLQRFAATTLQRHIRELEGRNVEDGALVVIDNQSGDVLAWVGSSGELSDAREVDGVLAPRLAGSTLKPFLYALAIERRLLTAASVLDDSPLAVTLPTGLYVPQNYDHAFKGQVSLRQALASSLNVPAVRTLALTGYEPF
ncbi:MAG TPA: transglycosylase domain-containing protein, partial [Burkholderiales bacterium]|nr:transglycosylase domain-containing protein [Burkholderiales bacterium]